jgi:hypothetical protein
MQVLRGDVKTSGDAFSVAIKVADHHLMAVAVPE